MRVMPPAPDAPQECVAALPWAAPPPLSRIQPVASDRHPKVKDAG